MWFIDIAPYGIFRLLPVTVHFAVMFKNNNNEFIYNKAHNKIKQQKTNRIAWQKIPWNCINIFPKSAWSRVRGWIITQHNPETETRKQFPLLLSFDGKRMAIINNFELLSLNNSTYFSIRCNELNNVECYSKKYARKLHLVVMPVEHSWKSTHFHC